MEHRKEVKPRELPDWAYKILVEKGFNRIRKATVYADEWAACGGNWHDANIKKLYFYRDGQVVEINIPNGDTAANTGGMELTIYNNLKVLLKPGDMVLETNNMGGHKSVRLYCYTSDFNPTFNPKILEG